MTSSFVLIKFVLRTWLFSHVQTSSHITWDIIERFWAPRDPSGTRWETEHVSQNLKRFADTEPCHKISNLCVTTVKMTIQILCSIYRYEYKYIMWHFYFMYRYEYKYTYLFCFTRFVSKKWSVWWVYWGRTQYHHLWFFGEGWIPHGQTNPTYEILGTW